MNKMLKIFDFLIIQSINSTSQKGIRKLIFYTEKNHKIKIWIFEKLKKKWKSISITYKKKSDYKSENLYYFAEYKKKKG